MIAFLLAIIEKIKNQVSSATNTIADIENTIFPVSAGYLEIPEDNFNNATTPGVYTISSNAMASGIANCPVGKAGRLCVWSPTSATLDSAWAVGEQIYSVPADVSEYRRRTVADGDGVITWGSWYLFTGTVVS